MPVPATSSHKVSHKGLYHLAHVWEPLLVTPPPIKFFRAEQPHQSSCARSKALDNLLSPWMLPESFHTEFLVARLYSHWPFSKLLVRMWWVVYVCNGSITQNSFHRWACRQAIEVLCNRSVWNWAVQMLWLNVFKFASCPMLRGVLCIEISILLEHEVASARLSGLKSTSFNASMSKDITIVNGVARGRRISICTMEQNWQMHATCRHGVNSSGKHCYMHYSEWQSKYIQGIMVHTLWIVGIDLLGPANLHLGFCSGSFYVRTIIFSPARAFCISKSRNTKKTICRSSAKQKGGCWYSHFPNGHLLSRTQGLPIVDHLTAFSLPRFVLLVLVFPMIWGCVDSCRVLSSFRPPRAPFCHLFTLHCLDTGQSMRFLCGKPQGTGMHTLFLHLGASLLAPGQHGGCHMIAVHSWCIWQGSLLHQRMCCCKDAAVSSPGTRISAFSLVLW